MQSKVEELEQLNQAMQVHTTQEEFLKHFYRIIVFDLVVVRCQNRFNAILLGL